MYVRKVLALVAILLGTACEVPVGTDPTNPDFGVSSVTVQPKAATLLVGDSAQMSATVLMSNSRPPASVQWTSTNTALATVSSAGLVRGRGAGSLYIRATSGSKRDSAALAVVAPSPAPVASVVVAPSSATLQIGGTLQLTTTLRDANGNPLGGRAVTWGSSTPGVATVSGSGLVTAASVGSATIIATSEGQSGSATITVAAVPVASVSVSPASASVQAGQTLQLTATPKDANGNALSGRSVVWASGNAGVATVSASGVVSGVAAGSTTITATSEGHSGTAAITVTAPVNNPGTVSDLAVVGVTDTGATLTFTEVNDGTGRPASYDVRYQVGGITWGPTALGVTQGTCATPVAGTAIGAKRTCTVLGLTPATAYQFQLVAFRGTLTVNAVFGGLSNITGATTTSSTSGGSGAPQPGPTDPIIFQDGFESGDLSGWTQDPSAGRYSLAADPTRVHAGRQSLQVLFTPTNGYGMITRWFMPGYDEVYVKFHVMFQEGFQNRRSDGAGMHFLTICGNISSDNQSCWGKPAIVPNGTDYFYAGLDPEEVSLPTLQPLSFYTYWPDMSCCYGNVLLQSSSKVALVGGQWQEVVFHIKLNTPGQSDGFQEVWLNGVKKLNQQNMRWRTTTNLSLNEIRFDNYMPGGLRTQHVWLDDVTVWRPSRSSR